MAKYDLLLKNGHVIDPVNNLKAYYNRGIVYSALGQYEKAKADYRKALTIDPDNEDAKFNLALLE